jgi:hypothetical protein
MIEKSRKFRWAGRVAMIGVIKGANKIFVKKPIRQNTEEVGG